MTKRKPPEGTMSNPATEPAPPTAPEATAAAAAPAPVTPEPVAELVERTPISEAEAERLVYRYIGTDAFDGIPARDLTVLDIERLEPSQRRELVPPRYERA